VQRLLIQGEGNDDLRPRVSGLPGLSRGPELVSPGHVGARARGDESRDVTLCSLRLGVPDVERGRDHRGRRLTTLTGPCEDAVSCLPRMNSPSFWLCALLTSPRYQDAVACRHAGLSKRIESSMGDGSRMALKRLRRGKQLFLLVTAYPILTL
jgi:hypothetical protein